MHAMKYYSALKIVTDTCNNIYYTKEDIKDGDSIYMKF